MFRPRNSGRSFRKKGGEDTDSTAAEGGTEEGDGSGAAPAVVPAKKDKKKAKEQVKGVLSFHGDAEEEEDAELERKLRKKKEKAAKKGKLRVGAPLPQSTATASGAQRSSAGEYSADKLRELQKNAISISTASLAPPPEKDTGDALIKLSGSFKPAKGREHSPQVMDEIKDEENPLPPPPRPDQPTSLTAPSSAKGAPSAAGTISDEEQEEEENTVIPNEETIRRAKEKRERLRRVQGATDYIALHDSGAGDDIVRRQKDRESDDSGDDLDEDKRLKFIGGPPEKQSGAGVFSHTAPVGDDELDEEDGWVAEQIRKGTGGAAGLYEAPNPRPASNQPRAAQLRSSVHSSSANTAAAVMESLRAAHSRLTDKKKISVSKLQKTKESLQSSVASISELEEQLVAAKERFACTQEFKAYMADLCDCLQEKTAIIDELEVHLMEALQSRADAIREHRTLEEEERAAPLEAAVSRALHVLSQGGAAGEATLGARAAEEAAEEAMLKGLGADLDEFGRDLNVEKRKGVQKRAMKRAKRREKLQKRQIALAGRREPSFGESASEESGGELEHYSRRRKEVQAACETVFKDADDDFSSVAAVKQRLEAFKARYPKYYQQAYVPASLPALFAPYVRLELLTWDMLELRASLDKQQWYQQLFDYGMGEGCMGDDDEDNELVPQIVQKVVLPYVAKILHECWDPRHPGHTRAARKLLADMLIYMEPDNKDFQNACQGILRQLERATDSCQLPLWPPAATSVCPAAAELQAYSFGVIVRMITNIAMWDGLLAPQPLQEMALTKLSARCLPYIRSAGNDITLGLERLERVCSGLPRSWFPSGAPPPAAAAPLREAAESLARTAEAKRLEGRWKQERVACASKLAQLLTQLGSPQRAASMAGLAALRV